VSLKLLNSDSLKLLDRNFSVREGWRGEGRERGGRGEE
jgi:hypothetical protein